ncbi:tol-pal system YbgF family protein [Pseudarcicella hirudinis]|uniref:tetratricopeptide repeat protein n=1 Tax=Pseudarcicella hirudinis TaxID=1079859 RepID=UPI0035EB248B
MFYILLWILDNASFEKVTARNQAKVQAAEAYRKHEYQLACKYYNTISQNSFFTSPEVLLNTAHALYEAKDTLNAFKKYTQLSNLPDTKIASTTFLQLGMIACQKGDSANALAMFKKALIVKPENDLARFNYELLKKKYNQNDNQTNSAPDKSENNREQHKKSPEKPEQEQSEHRNKQEVLKNDVQRDMLKTLKDYNLTPEKARMILDAMKNSEVQYIQQRQKTVNKGTDIKQKW